MALSKQLRKDIHSELVKGFSADDLKLLVGFHFDGIQLEAITSANGNLLVMAFDLLNYAERNGMLTLLLEAAIEERPQIEIFKTLQQRFEVQNAPPAPPKQPTKPRPKPQQPKNPLAQPPDNVRTPHIVKDTTPLGFEWCWVPAGTFIMGSTDGRAREKPEHQRHLDGFWMMRTPVTNANFGLFIDAGGYTAPRWWSQKGWQALISNKWKLPRYWTDKKWNGANQPVVGVSWYEAEAFCNWATTTSGLAISLPTEAQWEKAARGPHGQTYPRGNADPDHDRANYYRKVDQTTPVGKYSPFGDSPYGCVDMAGNVWEWTASWFEAYQGNDQQHSAFGEKVRVVRGGSWSNYDDDILRSAYRDWFYPVNGLGNLGFRCASSPL